MLVVRGFENKTIYSIKRQNQDQHAQKNWDLGGIQVNSYLHIKEDRELIGNKFSKTAMLRRKIASNQEYMIHIQKHFFQNLNKVSLIWWDQYAQRKLRRK